MIHSSNFAMGAATGRTYLLAILYLLFPIALGVSNLALLILLVFWLASWRHRETWSIIRHTPIIWLLGGLYLLVLLGLAYTSASADWYTLHLTKYARLIYAIALICLLWNDERAQKLALNAFIVAMLFTLGSTWLNVWVLLPWSASQELGWGRSHHVFGDYITQNVMMSFFAAVALNRCIGASGFSRRLAWSVVMLLAIVSITHLSQGRTGYLLLIASLVTYAVFTLRGKWLAVALLGLVAAACTLLLTSSLLEMRFEQAIKEARTYETDKASSIGHRLRNYETTPKLIAKAPFLGHGTGAYHVQICEVLDSPQECERHSWHPHNQFLFLGADHGLLGMALYGGIIAAMYLIAWRSSAPSGRPLLGVLASILLVDSLLNSPLWSSRESQFFMYMLALLVCMAMTPQRGANTDTGRLGKDG